MQLDFIFYYILIEYLLTSCILEFFFTLLLFLFTCSSPCSSILLTRCLERQRLYNIFNSSLFVTLYFLFTILYRGGNSFVVISPFCSTHVTLSSILYKSFSSESTHICTSFCKTVKRK